MPNNGKPEATPTLAEQICDLEAMIGALEFGAQVALEKLGEITRRLEAEQGAANDADV